MTKTQKRQLKKTKHALFKGLKSAILSIIIFEMTFGSFVLGLIGQENRFRDLWRKGTDGQMDRQFEQANHATSEEEFNKLVGRGLGVVRGDWEARAEVELEKELRAFADPEEKKREREKLEVEKGLAKEEWEEEVQREIDERRGFWKVYLQSPQLERVWNLVDRAGLVLGMAQADAAAKAGATAVDKVKIWDETINAVSSNIQTDWEQSLEEVFLEVQGGLSFSSEVERLAFESELARLKEQYRADYEYEESSLLSSKRMYFVSQQNQNEDMANRLAQETNPSELAKLLVERTKQQIAQNGGVFVYGENTLPNQVALNFQNGDEAYQEKVLKALEEGQGLWQKAIDEMILGKLRYDRDVEMQWRSGEADWTNAYGQLVKAREEWVATVQKQIQEGLKQWDASEATMVQNKAKAIEELDRTLATNKSSWDAHVRGITDVITVGADTLSTIASNLDWFEDALARAEAPGSGYNSSVVAEYRQQRDYWKGLETRYRNLVAATQNQIHDQDIRGTGVGQGLLVNAGGSDPYVLSVQEFELKLAREELKLLEAKRDRAKAVYDYAVGNVGQKTAAQIAAELDTIRQNFKAKEAAYLSLLSELNGSGSSVFGTPGMDPNSSVETGSTVTNPDTILNQLTEQNRILEEKRKALELARASMGDASVAYEAALKIQVLIRNPGMLGQIGDLTSDSSAIQGNTGLRGEIVQAQEELERQREVLRQQERKMYELQYERENAFRSQTFYAEINQRVLEFEKLKENRTLLVAVLDGDGTLEEKIDSLLAGDKLVQLYGNQVSVQVKQSLETWKASLAGLDSSVVTAVTSHDNSITNLITKINLLDVTQLETTTNQIPTFVNQYENIISRLYADSRLDASYLNAESIIPTYEYLQSLTSSSGDALSLGKEGINELKTAMANYQSYVSANVGNQGSLAYSAKIVELEQAIGTAVNKIDQYNQYIAEVSKTVQYLNVNVLDALSKTDAIVDATLTGSERATTKENFRTLRGDESNLSAGMLTSLNGVGTLFSDSIQAMGHYGQMNLVFRNALEDRNNKTKQVSDGLVSLFDGFELEYRAKEVELTFLLDETGDEAKLTALQKQAEQKKKVAGAEVNAKAMEMLLGYLGNLGEGDRNVESIYLRMLKDSEVISQDTKTDASSILERRAMATVLEFFRSSRGAFANYIAGSGYDDFIEDMGRQKDYADALLSFYESGKEYTATEREEIRWNGSANEKKFLKESFSYGESFFFQAANGQVAREIAVSQKVDDFVSRVRSGEVLSILKEEYFKRQENKATGLLKELHDAVSGLDDITASRLLSDSFRIGNSTDRDSSEETRRANLLSGHLANNPGTPRAQLSSLLDVGKLIEIFGEKEGLAIHSEITNKILNIDNSAAEIIEKSQLLNPRHVAIESEYPSYLDFFNDTKKTGYTAEIQKLEQYLTLKDFEDTSQPILDSNLQLTGYEKPFAGLDYSELETIKTSLDGMIANWGTIKSELESAHADYMQILTTWRAATPGTEEYAELAEEVSEKLKDFSAKQMQATDYVRELTIQLEEATEKSQSLLAEYKSSIGIADKTLLTISSFGKINSALPGFYDYFNSAEGRPKYHFVFQDGPLGLSVNIQEKLADLEAEALFQKTSVSNQLEQLATLNSFSETMYKGITFSDQYLALYARRKDSEEAGEDYLENLDERIVVYASAANQNTISQENLISYTKGIREFLTAKAARGEEVNASLWESLANAETFTKEMAGLKYYQNLSAAEKADTAKLKTDYEESKTTRETAEEATRVFAELRSMIDGLEAQGMPLDQSLDQIGASLTKFETLKTKLDQSGYNLDSSVIAGMDNLKAFAWENQKVILAKAYLGTITNNGTIEKFLSDVKSGKFVLPGPSGKLERTANFLGAALTEDQITEIEELITPYDLQARLLRTSNLAQVDSLLLTYDEDLRDAGKELALRQSLSRIQTSLAQGTIPNLAQYPAELKNYILTATFEDYATRNVDMGAQTLANEFASFMRLSDSDRDTVMTYAGERGSKNPSTYLPDSLKEYHLLNTYYQNWTEDLSPEDTAGLANWLNTNGYESNLIGALTKATRMNYLLRSYSGENIDEYITSASSKLGSPVTDEEKQSILLSQAGLYDPTHANGIDPFFVIQQGVYLNSYSYKTGFSDLANSLKEESVKLAVASIGYKAEEDKKKLAWDISNKVVKVESYLSYTQITPQGQATPTESVQVTNRLRELEFQAEHRLGNFLAIVEEYNSYSYDTAKEDQNPSLKVLLKEIKNSGYSVRDAVYSKNENLEYEFLGGFDNARKVVDNYVKNNLPGRSANEDPYALTNQAKGSVSSNASSIVTAGEEIGVIFNIKQQANGNYLAELEKYKDIYEQRLADFDTAELGFQTQQTVVTAKQNEYNNKQEQVKTAYDLLEQSSNEMSLLSAVYDYVTIKDYSTHDGISGESQTALSSPLELVRKRYQDAEKAVTDKLAEITLLQKRADDRMKLSELQADTAVAANKAEAEEWAERAMRFSIAETKIKDKMQELQRQINSARASLEGTMSSLVGTGLNPAVLDGRLDFNNSGYKSEETRLREFYKIADGIATNKIGGWDFIHGGRGVTNPPTYSGGLAYIHPSININGYVSSYGNGTESEAAQRAFDGVWVLDFNAAGESAYHRMTSYSYGEYEAKMNYALGNVMGRAMLIFAFLSLGNPITGMEAITRNKTWIDSKIAIDNRVNTAREQANTLKTLQEELNKYTDISTGEQLINMLKGEGGYIDTGLEDSDIAYLTGASGQLKNGTINWTGGKEPLSVDRLVGKNGDPIIQKRAVKDSYGLYIREGVVTAGSPSTNSNVGYANDGRMVNIMTSADEFVGSLASISKTQYTIEKEEYYAAQEAAIVRGVKADKREILDDRDRFYSNLLNKVTGGTGKNIEYDMYKTLVEDYYGQGNVADQLYEINESQQREYQIKVWDNKEKDFQAKKADWIENVNYLMNTGSARFNDMLTSFNQSWDQWRRDFKEETDKGKAEHMARIEEALKKKTDWEVSLLNQARKGDQFEIDQVYAEIQKTIANMGAAPNAVLLQNNANKILNTIMNSKPQVLDNRMLEQGMYADVQFFVDELKKSKYDESNVEKMKSMTKEMEDRSKQMAVLQTLDSLWSLPLTFEATIAEQNKALDEQLTMQLLQDSFIKMGPGYVRSAVDKLGNPTYQVLPIYAAFVYIKPDKLPAVKDSNGKEWDLTDYQALQGKGGPASAELTMMVRLARNQMQTDFKQTFDPEKSENREVGLTMLDPKAMARVAQAAQSALGQLATDPQKMFEFNSADEKGKEAMIESAKNSGYLVGPTVGGTFGTHHFNQFYPILKMKEKYNEIKAEGEAVQGDPFVKSAKSLGGPMAATYVAKNLDTLKAVDSVLSAIPVVDRLNPLAMIKSFANGGILGVVTNVASVVTEAVSQFFTGSTVKVSMDYTYDQGFGASVDVGYGVGAARVSVANVGYSEFGGFTASLGVSGKVAGIELGARVTYSEKEGFGASVSAGVGNFKLAADYSQSGGFGVSAQYGNFVVGADFNKAGSPTFFAGATNSSGSKSAGLSYSKEGGVEGYAKSKLDTGTAKLTYGKENGFGASFDVNTKAGVASVGFSQRGGFDASFTNTTQLANGINAKSSIGFNSKSGFSASVGVSADFGNGVTSGGLSLNKNGIQYQAPSYQAPQAAGTGVIHSLQDLEGQVDTIAEANSEKLLQEKRVEEAEKFRKKQGLPESMTLEEIEALRKNLAEAGVATGTGADGTSRKGFLAELSGGVSDMWNGIAGNYQAATHKGYVDENGVFHQRTCFVAGTKVHTKNGLKNIEDIQVGDVVLSWNETTGEREYKVVTELFLHEINQLYEVKTTKGTTLETTWNHPFWVVDRKEWVEVKDLRVGDVLALADGALVEISHIRSYYVEPTKVYNFEVEDNHSYFVGEDGVLVHNYDIKTGTVEKGDNLIKITKELNDKYGTNYSVEDIKKMNGLKDSDKIHENMRIVSPESFKEMDNENKARYFKKNEKGKENDEFFSRIISVGPSLSTPWLDLNAEAGTYTELKIRGDFEMRTTYFGFEAGVYNREFMPANVSVSGGVNLGLVKGSLEDLSTYSSISGSIYGNGGTYYYDKNSGESKGGKISIAPAGSGLKIPNITTNTATTTGSAQYKTIKLSEDYYYAPQLRKTREYVFGEKKNGK
ncbi:polymorphic toxin-type HINT domain-containing protein [Leptospira bandrabouensis]|uniref:polymorphic toxin-type HINT domain-containing protein n=1 Tax=Leptospira bandrabouensis TaxID=2484903 RepID=UPI001EEA441E|nr:polymorphic toxin-type HINT domain-containing protein [Leptospira bandrabouensis]MCG6153951.1 LysM peptidoglycan-binding domain-containing protein [Leptospira bandrabouensis]